jgi:hypothetical protein
MEEKLGPTERCRAEKKQTQLEDRHGYVPVADFFSSIFEISAERESTLTEET